MKEHPIPMSTDMVKAILENRKTQTRRVISPQPLRCVIRKCPGDNITFSNFEMDLSPGFGWIPIGKGFKCPYGQPGDRLWVREGFSITQGDGQPNDFYITYRAGEVIAWRDNGNLLDYPVKEGWRPSIFMPRWASRITLEITNIRVQRVQEISHEDAIAEGAEYMPAGEVREERLTVPQIVFSRYWDSINAKRGYSWDSNPFCWVIEFQVLKPLGNKGTEA